MLPLTRSIDLAYNKLFTGTLKKVLSILPLPRPILFTGADSSLELCENIARQGYKNILIVTDKVLLEIGVLDGIKQSLEDHGVQYSVYDGVLPDPTDIQVEDGLKILLEHQCEAILAVGGGSSIDAGKAIAARATNLERSLQKLSGYLKLRAKPLPFFAIPTTAGTGSEATIGAVLSDPETHQKRLIIDPRMMPLMAALDGKLMQGLPPAITAATAMDALTHAIEAYISRNADDDTDAFAKAAVQLIMQYLPKVMADGKNIEARQQLALASHYAGLAVTKASLGYVHAIAHNIGAVYSIPHGSANALVLPFVLEFSKDAAADRLAQLANASGLITHTTSDDEAANALIEKIRNMLHELNIIDINLQIQSEDIPSMAHQALQEAHYNYPVPKYMTLQECETMLKQMQQTYR